MKKLILTNKQNSENDISLSFEHSQCDFCGINKKNCIKNSIPSKYNRYQYLDKTRKGVVRYIREQENLEHFSYICVDCAKQINKLMNNVKSETYTPMYYWGYYSK